ncbi:MAG: GNAT family N-acetyltransferase [Betaproteobacteria bacterium]|jgi:putative hemolysin|nr:GNAT family N-acetyltransferase [Betaproteobacteria bacterium]NBT11581.1 GNAT family N-acetyltransferase [Betaproteobacteria bacterium]NBU50703.1 GNAT family N-acetyltransferase [Betaproteobacteria bacterium]NCW26339.1 GNAT family N-acetyltransferase [Betaproteobacteria bacterium]
MHQLSSLQEAHLYAPPELKNGSDLLVHWARHEDEVRAAQRLRHEVFHGEWGAQVSADDPGLDKDDFDAHCEHLMVSTAASDDAPSRVVGTYRILLPDAARRLGRYYTETEFDLASLHDLRPSMAELGRSCIAAPWRTGGVILMLWAHLVRFLHVNGVQQAIGCASIPMPDGGANAARLWQELRSTHLAPERRRVTPLVALPVDLLPSQGPAEWPPLVRGYIKMGAQVLGAPAWDSAFGCADLPMMLDFSSMAPAYRKRFIGA